MSSSCETSNTRPSIDFALHWQSPPQTFSGVQFLHLPQVIFLSSFPTDFLFPYIHIITLLRPKRKVFLKNFRKKLLSVAFCHSMQEAVVHLPEQVKLGSGRNQLGSLHGLLLAGLRDRLNRRRVGATPPIRSRPSEISRAISTAESSCWVQHPQ